MSFQLSNTFPRDDDYFGLFIWDRIQIFFLDRLYLFFGLLGSDIMWNYEFSTQNQLSRYVSYIY